MIARISSTLRGLRTVSLAVVALAIVAPQDAHAQARPAASPRGSIAVIDIKYILDNHRRFQASMEGLKQEFKAVSEQLQRERQAILELQQKLEEYTPGTQDYRQLDQDIARRQADWTVKANQHKKDFRNRESQLLWTIYYEIRMETKKIAEQQGVGLVFQFNGEEIDSKKPQEVIKAIARPLVYVNQGHDITPHVLQKLNAGAPAPRPNVSDQRGIQGVPQRRPN